MKPLGYLAILWASFGHDVHDVKETSCFTLVQHRSTSTPPSSALREHYPGATDGARRERGTPALLQQWPHFATCGHQHADSHRSSMPTSWRGPPSSLPGPTGLVRGVDWSLRGAFGRGSAYFKHPSPPPSFETAGSSTCRVAATHCGLEHGVGSSPREFYGMFGMLRVHLVQVCEAEIPNWARRRKSTRSTTEF